MSTIAGTSTSSTGPTPGCTSWSSRSDEKGPVRFPFRSRHACTSADLPFQADPADRPVRAGRQLGVRRAHRVRRDGQGARPELRGREQARRRWRHRDGRGGARRARRLHADHRHVPYKGTGPMVIDRVAGRTQVGVAGTPPLLQHVKAGKLRAVAVGTPGRLAVLPGVRSVAEQGYPGFETSQWYGLIGPARMPDSVIRSLSEEAAKAVRSKAVLERLATESAIPVGSTPREFAQFIAKEQARWKEVIQKAHIKAD